MTAWADEACPPYPAAAVGLVGKESDRFRFTLKHSLLLTTLVGIITTLQAYVFTWMIP
jgi:L-lactate permease